MQLKTNNYLINFNDGDALIKEKSTIELLERLFKKLDDSQQLLSQNTFDLIELEISLINKIDMQEINKVHREKDYVTDVLSFPTQENIRSGEFEILNNSLYLGDLVVCHEVCEQQAKEHNISYNDEFIHLITHGLLHLYGYDHEISEDEDLIMRGLEEKVILLLT